MQLPSTDDPSPTAVEQYELPLIELREIRKRYGGGADGREVLRGVSLSIHAGEFVAIMGPSGSGKSTLMNLLGCLDRASAGSYLLNGNDVSRLDGAARAELRSCCFGFIFQQYHLLAGRTALQNVELPALYAGASRAERRRRAQQLLEQLGLGERLQYRPHQLSGGQQQRVSIARALINGGSVVLADEPTGALDGKSGAEVMRLLEELWLAGHTVILITHDAAVANIAERVIEIRDGLIASDRQRDGQRLLRLVGKARRSPLLPSGRRARAPLLGSVREALAVARQSLFANPLRTLLTLLGIVVGAASVVSLLDIAEGARRAVLTQLEVFGTNRLYVSPGAEDARGSSGKLTEADADLVRAVPNVSGSMPYLKGKVTVRYGNVDHRTTGVAVTEDFPRILNWPTRRGVFFDAADNRSLAPVALLGSKLARVLFPPGTDELRQFVLVNNVPFQIIGVLAEKGALSGDADDDDTIVFPYHAGSQRIFGTPYLSWISVQVQNIAQADATVQRITQVLTEKHRAKDFDVYNKAAAIRAQAETVDVMTSLLGFTAVISLAVGGLGVMNIMLMTVVERTREIGVRMATGARGLDILFQFTSEAVALAGIGGVLGVLAGLGMGRVALELGFPVVFSSSAALQAFLCALGTGALFGLVPAVRAARLTPVLALARE